MNKVRRDLNGETTLEFEGNNGTITLNATSAQDALKRARRLFRHMREVSVTGTAERYVVEFKVSLKYNRRLFRRANKLSKIDLTRENYDRLAATDRYMALLHAQLTGRETFLSDPMFLRGALLSLKNELLHQGQVASPDEFTDFDIVVHNLVESRS